MKRIYILIFIFFSVPIFEGYALSSNNHSFIPKTGIEKIGNREAKKIKRNKQGRIKKFLKKLKKKGQNIYRKVKDKVFGLPRATWLILGILCYVGALAVIIGMSASLSYSIGGFILAIVLALLGVACAWIWDANKPKT